MGNEPYRSIFNRADNPHRNLTAEQLADTRLCVSTLTSEQCRQFLLQLDDEQIKNAVYDRALCFPYDNWTHKIREAYSKQVNSANNVITTFENVYQYIENIFVTWKQVLVFKENDYNSMELKVLNFVVPSLDNIGVYSTFSDYTMSKINGLTALLRIGQCLVKTPIFATPRGRHLFSYDPLSRAVGNILSTTTTDAGRRQIINSSLEHEFMELAKDSSEIGLFSDLTKALTPGHFPCAYNIPKSEKMDKNKREASEHNARMSKKSKKAHVHVPKGVIDPGLKGAFASGSSSAQAQEPQGVTEGWDTGSSGSHNPFSRPSSAGLIAQPVFSKAQHGTPVIASKPEKQYNTPEQAQGGDHYHSSGLQGIAKVIQQHLVGTQGSQQAVDHMQAQCQQAENTVAGLEMQSTSEIPIQAGMDQKPTALNPLDAALDAALQQTNQQAIQEATQQEDMPTCYDGILSTIEAEIFKNHIRDSPNTQVLRAPVICRLIEGSCGMIQNKFKVFAELSTKNGNRDMFQRSLTDTMFALLWVLESCALDAGNTPLSAEVSRLLSRKTLIGSLWGTVKLVPPSEWKNLLEVEDIVCSEPLGVKMERIIQRLEETGVSGYGDLKHALENLRAGDVPAA